MPENKVIISIGCNAQYEVQMQHVRECLLKAFPDARFTEQLMSPAYGESKAAPYINFLAEFTTNLNTAELLTTLKDMENALGDTKELRSKGIVMMDLDMLQYNTEKYHLTDWTRPYIKTLLQRLCMLIFLLCSCVGITTAQSDPSAKELLSKAIEYYNGGKYHESILTFQKLEKSYRLNARYNAYMGYSLYKDEEYKDAVTYLEKSIPQLTAYSPFEQALYMFACAESLFNLQKYKEAIPWYNKAQPLVEGINKGDLYYHTGFSYYMTGNNSEAHRNLSEAVTLYSDSTIVNTLDELHRARKAQAQTMLKALK